MLNNRLNEKKLLEEGFVKVPFLNKQEVLQLKTFYETNPPDVKAPFHSTPLSSNVDYKRSVTNIIKETFTRSLNNNFSSDYGFFFGSYTVKEASKESEWNLHQDWTFIDEKKYSSVGVWVPLIDVDNYNGCLSVVRKSHKFLHNIRGTNTASEYANIADVIKSKYLTPIPMKAGEALFFMNSLLHYSPANFSNSPRVSVNCLMFPKMAKTMHFFKDDACATDEVEKFEISSETMMTHDFSAQERPKLAKSMGKVKLDTRGITQDQFEQLYRFYNTWSIAKSIKMVKELLLK